MKVVIKNNEYTKGELIKIMREWSEKTQKEFAKDIGKSEISIQKYETQDFFCYRGGPCRTRTYDRPVMSRML